jgi:dipeptidyl aminopeptidase/acylaminoacyl peptidase
MRYSCVLLALAALVWNIGFSQASNGADQSTLAIRNESLLSRLRTLDLPHTLQEPSVSPDGRWILYVETVSAARYQFAPRDPSSDSRWQRLWLVSVQDRRTAVVIEDSEGLDRFRTRGLLKVRWSPDGREFALLQQRGRNRTLLIFPARDPKQVKKADLPGYSDESDSDTLVDWFWRSPRTTVTLVLQQLAIQSVLPSQESTFVWAWSRSEASRQQQFEHWARSHRDGTPCYAVNVDFERQGAHRWEPRDSESGDPLRLVITEEANGNIWPNWYSADGRNILVVIPDRAGPDVGNDRLMWLLNAKDPRGDLLKAEGARVYKLDLGNVQEGVRAAYAHGPGTIAMALSDRSGQVVGIQAQPELATWPMQTQWGRLEVLTSKSGAQASLVTPLPLRVSLFAGPRPGVFYHTDHPSAPSPSVSRISEANLAIGGDVEITPPGLRSTAMDVSPDGTTIAAILENVTTPPFLAVWSSHTRRWVYLTKRATRRLEGAGLVQSLSWRSKDDLYDVEGLVVLPSGFEQHRPLPLVVILKGGHNMATAGFWNQFDPYLGVNSLPAVLLAAAGYAVLMPNHRGTEYSPLAATKALVGHYGSQIPMDVEAGVDALISRGWVDPNRVGLYGHSNGSAQVSFAISHSTRYAAAVVEDGPHMLPEAYIPEELLTYGAGPDSFYDGERNAILFGFDTVREPGRWADPFRVRTPLLLRWAVEESHSNTLTTGANILDLLNSSAFSTSAASGQTAKLIYALRSNHVPIDVIVDRDGHWTQNRTYMLEWQSRVIQWFDYFLRGVGDNPIPARPGNLAYGTEAH